MPYSDYGYLDPLHIVWRKGTPEDPYVDRIEYLKVVNQRVILSEIPSSRDRVRIDGMVEVNIDKAEKRKLEPNEFSVNYAIGMIQVHESKEAQTLNVYYKGRGFIQYPSSRIYHQDEFNDIVRSLDNIINESLKSIENIEDKVRDYQQIKELLLGKIDDINIATDNANRATENAEIATDKALDAYETTRLVFKPYVNNFWEIGTTYPNPEVGWTVQVYDTGIRYRYDGIEWVPIDLFGGNIPTASPTRDGLMSKESYNKLETVEDNLNNLKNEFDGRNTERVLTFVFPYLDNGVNNIAAKFPFDGTIQSIEGICTGMSSEVATEIDIEKSTDMETWNSLFTNSYLTFDVGEHFDNQKHVIGVLGVTAGDLFRINVRTLSNTIQGVTIQIKIKIND